MIDKTQFLIELREKFKLLADETYDDLLVEC